MVSKTKLLIILITLIILIVYTRYNRIYQENKRKIKLNQLETIAKSGDIILYNHIPKNNILRYMHIRLQQFLIGISYTHVGLVHKKSDGKLYICEVTAKDKYKELKYGESTGNTSCYLLKDRIKNYEGIVSIRLLNKSLTIEQEKLLAQTLNQTYHFVNNIRKHILYNCLIRKICPGCTSYKRSGIYCSEYISLLLKTIGVLNKNKDTACIYPLHFTRGYDTYSFVPGYSYTPEYEIVVT